MTAPAPRSIAQGRATAEGTARFAGRAAGTAADHFSDALGLRVSSIGLGTYLGDADEATDAAYRSAVVAALGAGCNLVDSAVNYRYQFSERAVGEALGDALARGLVTRDEVVVCTKGGYLSFDGPPVDARRWIEETFVAPGIIGWQDIVAHNVMHPAYLRHEIASSLRNLHLETIDLYYLHNPESQLEGVDRRTFMTRMAACFEELERAADAGTIGAYGIATWNGLRAGPESREHLPLADLVAAAREVGGDRHRFRAVQLPINLGMLEAVTRANHRVDDDLVPLVQSAARLGLAVFASGSLLQGRLTKLPAGFAAMIPGFDTDAQRALQFVRSTPSVAAALVGMKSPAHVAENLSVARRPRLSPGDYADMFGDA